MKEKLITARISGFIGRILALSLALPLISSSVAAIEAVYATTFLDSTIRKYNLNDTDLGTFVDLATFANDMAFDKNGNIYVAMGGVPPSGPEINTIRRFTPDGTDLGNFAATGLLNPVGLAFDSSGNLYVANHVSEGYGTIRKFDPTGIDLGIFGSTYFAARDLEFDAFGNLCKSVLLPFSSSQPSAMPRKTAFCVV